MTFASFVVAAAAALSFTQEGDVWKARVRVAPKGRTCLTAAYRQSGGAPGSLSIYGADGKRCDFSELDEGGLYHSATKLFYQTVTIPEEMTAGKTEVTLTLKAERQPTRPIVSLWTHVNPLFEPPAKEREEARLEKIVLPDFKPISASVRDAAIRRTVELMDITADHAAMRQMWSPDWREKCARGEWHEDLVGAFDVPWCGKDGVMDVTATKDRIPGHYDHLNNNGPMILSAVLAIAYTTPGLKRHGDKETLQRIAAHLDFCRRAQGLSGSYWSAWVRGKWMGGPNRGPTSGTPLDGAGLRGIGHALVLTAKAMEREGMLDELVDDDCDPSTPKIKRRKAYLDLMDGLIGHFAGKGGHAPNQETYQLDALRFCIRARRLLGGPSPKEPDKTEFVKRLRGATGAVAPGEPSWVSPRGVPLEWDGYSVEYGRGQDVMYYRLWESYPKLGFLRERAKIGGDAFPHFVYPVRRHDGKPSVDVCAYLNFRHRNMIGGDGYGPSQCQLLDFENPSHIRLQQLDWIGLDEKAIARWEAPRAGNWYWSAAYGFMDGAQDRIKILRRMTKPGDPLCAKVRLPMESGEPDFVWGDPRAQCVAFKDGESRIMMNFNQWRHSEQPKAGGTAYVYARRPAAVQYMRVRHDELLEDAKGGAIRWGCHSLALGDWLVVQCSDQKKGVDFCLPDGFSRGAVDLATKKPVKSAVLRLAPGETRVLKRHGWVVRQPGK